MNKKILAVILAFVLTLSALTFNIAGVSSKTPLTEQPPVYDGYLVKYNEDVILEKSSIKNKYDNYSKMTGDDQSKEQNNDTEDSITNEPYEFDADFLVVEAAFEELLPEVSSVYIIGELSKDNFGYKTQLISIESGEDKEIILAQLREIEGVEYAEPNYRIETMNDPGFSNQWGLNPSSTYNINIGDAWNITYGNSDILVAVIDTGIDINHPNLKANIVPGWNFTTYVNSVQNGDSNVYSDPVVDAHGTHIAGIIAAPRNNIGIQGVAPNVKIMPLKVLGADGGTIFHAIKAIEYANDKGIKIANCSWGTGGYSQFLYDAMNQSDILFICASGNGINNDGYGEKYGVIADDFITANKTIPQLYSMAMVLGDQANKYHETIIMNGKQRLKDEAKQLADIFTIGDSSMRVVANIMFDHFINGDGDDVNFEFRNSIFTSRAVDHPSTQVFINNTQQQIINYIRENNGNPIRALTNVTLKSIINSFNRPKYNSSVDHFNGLTVCVHDTWGNYIEIKNYAFDGKNFHGTLRYTIYDHFGLGDDDVTGAYGGLSWVLGWTAQFTAWYVLQHYIGCNSLYKPFVTYIETEVVFSGTI